MARESAHMRQHIAHLAARLMACDGVSDPGQAKRKAARQAGAPDSHNLPTNEEVEAALRSYQQIYQAEAQPRRLRALRETALEIMQRLAPFNPYLTGSLVGGNVGSQADIRLHLYTDRGKDFELFLANHGVVLRQRDVRLVVGDAPGSFPAFELDTPEALVRITVLEERHLRQPVRTSTGGEALERAGIAQVQALVAEEGPVG